MTTNDSTDQRCCIFYPDIERGYIVYWLVLILEGIGRWGEVFWGLGRGYHGD